MVSMISGLMNQEWRRGDRDQELRGNGNVIGTGTESGGYENECTYALCTRTFTDRLNSFSRLVSSLKIKQLININDNELNGKSVK